MAASNWKKALGLVKDRTSIGIAKIASSRVPDLDVAIVKATSHDDMAVEEKYIQEILHLTAISLGYAHACLQLLTKRIRKTRDWVVAIKVLMVTHRLLREGNPAFEDDLKTVSRRNLNVSNFKDDSHSNSWDFSAFVRNYAAYLDARLDCFIYANIPRKVRSSRDDYSYGFNSTSMSRRHSFSTFSYDAEKSKESSYRQQNVCVKGWEPDTLIEMLPNLQRMIDRVLACRATGAAKNHRLVQVPLYMVVKESFQIFSELCEGIGVLLNVYFDMKLEDCSRTFDIYARFAKQSDALSSFYNNSMSMGICRPSEYPPIEKVSQDYLETLEDFLRNQSRSRSNNRKSFIPDSEKVINHVTYESVYGVKALPAPPTETPQMIPDKSTSSKLKKQPDLIDLGNDVNSSETWDDRMALALFPSSSGGNTTKGWATFDTAPQEASPNTSTQQKASSDTTNIGLSGWELALVSDASNLANAKTSPMVGSFDRFRFESMYAQEASRFRPVLPGSASSFAAFSRPASSLLALPGPGPPSATSHDPFAASATVVPPAYVQLADLQEKQRHLLQEQQLWQQSQVNGTYGNFGLMQFYSTPYPVGPQGPFGVPYYGMAGSYAQTR